MEQSLLRNIDRTLKATAEAIEAALNTPINPTIAQKQIEALTGNTPTNSTLTNNTNANLKPKSIRHHKKKHPVKYRIWLEPVQQQTAQPNIQPTQTETKVQISEQQKPSITKDLSHTKPAAITFTKQLLATNIKETKEYQNPFLKIITNTTAPPPGTENYYNITINGYPYRTMWLRKPYKGQKILNILMARSSKYSYHEMAEYLRLLLIMGAIIMLGGILVTFLMTSLLLKPIRLTAKRLQQITHQNLDQEHLEGLPACQEMQPFVTAVRNMLTRLDNAMQQQKQFIADASHELRTPLTIVKSTLQTINRKQRSVAEYQQAINESLEDLARMEQLTENLLSLARLDENKNPHKNQQLQLNKLLKEIVKLYTQKAKSLGKKSTIILQQKQTEPVHITGDETKLKQLFGNIIDNALKYGPTDKPIQITINKIINTNTDTNINATKNKNTTPNNLVEICIHDEGGQIPPQALKHLFDRFYREDASRCRKTGGSGLGLSIAREIARVHNGTITITSEKTNGTNVCVTLPANP